MTYIIHNATSRSHLPKINVGESMFIVCDGQEHVARIRANMRQRTHRNRLKYTVSCAELDGQRGVLVVCDGRAPVVTTSGASPRSLADMIYDWDALPPKTRTVIDGIEVSKLVASARRWTRLHADHDAVFVDVIGPMKGSAYRLGESLEAYNARAQAAAMGIISTVQGRNTRPA